MSYFFPEDFAHLAKIISEFVTNFLILAVMKTLLFAEKLLFSENISR